MISSLILSLGSDTVTFVPFLIFKSELVHHKLNEKFIDSSLEYPDLKSLLIIDLYN